MAQQCFCRSVGGICKYHVNLEGERGGSRMSEELEAESCAMRTTCDAFSLCLSLPNNPSIMHSQAAGLAGSAALYVVMRSMQSTPKRERRLTDVYAEDIHGEGQDYVPPLPPDVKDLLSAANLAHLSCQDGENPPHTSLMNFTFVADEEDVIVMTTRRDTKKFVLMENCESVSLLIHDFPHVKAVDERDTHYNRTLSLSIYGLVRIEEGTRAMKYKKIHLNKNMQYRQFIEVPSPFPQHPVVLRKDLWPWTH
jgi:nitroimidazol reductase NimA-like FMN-containing flavoprotein (pyridoxamine 5'-phosphate oxidase superfamily)